MIFAGKRPLSRSTIKFASRLLLGRSRAHFQDHFPGLRLDRSRARGRIFYRGSEVGSLHATDILCCDNAAAAIYIVGSGPSINECDLRRVESRTAILLNGAIHLMALDIPEPLAVAVEDERFVWRHFDLMRERVVPGTICLLSVGVIRAICERDMRWLADKRVILVDNIKKPYKHKRRESLELRALDFVVVSEWPEQAGISLDPDKGVFQGGSVAISAVQFAMACRPRLIGLFGIDIVNADQPRFYETTGGAAYSGIARAEKRIIPHFVLAKEIASARNITFLNFSAISALRRYEFGYDDRFSRVGSEAAQ